MKKKIDTRAGVQIEDKRGRLESGGFSPDEISVGQVGSEGGNLKEETGNLPTEESGAGKLAIHTGNPALSTVTTDGPRVDAATAFLSSFPNGNTKAAYRDSLVILARLASNGAESDPRKVPWQSLRYEHVSAMRAKLAEMYASTTANLRLNALRGVLKTCWRMGLMSNEDYARASDVAGVRGTRPQAGRALAPEEITRLFEAAEGGTTHSARTRDALLITLLAQGGLRGSEACKLKLGDWSDTTGALTVQGKGNKSRTVYLSEKGKERLHEWVRTAHRDWPNPEKPLLTRLSSKGLALERKPLSYHGLTRVLDVLCKRAGIEEFASHDLRRTFITRLLEKGADAMVVSKLAGHANMQTTMLYDRRGEQAKKDALKLLDDE